MSGELIFKIDENEDYTIINLLKNNKEIGKLTLEVRTIDDFIENEINNVIDTQEERELESEEIETLLEASDDVSKTDKIFYIESLKIDKEYRKNGYRTKLMNYSLNYMKEKSLNQNNSSYINACPSYDVNKISLNDLVSFYENFGFKQMLNYGNTCSMICPNIKELKKYKPKPKQIKQTKEIKTSSDYSISLI